VRVAPLAAAPPARAADCDAETKDRLARLARAAGPESPIALSILPRQFGHDQAALANQPQSGRPGASIPRYEVQLLNVSPNRVRIKELDEACAQAFDLARAAAEELAGPNLVGPLVGSQADGDRLVTHLFACLDPAYRGWRWAVTVARAARSKLVTVNESLLLPGPDSLLAPEWVPWSERVRPGDLGVGDLMPASSDDERLVPVAVLGGDDAVLEWDDGDGWADGGRAGEDEEPHLPGAAAAGSVRVASRPRVLSAIGRDLAAERWYSSEHGPGSPLASAAPGQCATCGFLVPLSEPLGRAFGVCANGFAPDDGRVVALDHGCGAHSEATTPRGREGVPVPVIDEIGYDLVDAPGVSLTDTVFGSLDED